MQRRSEAFADDLSLAMNQLGALNSPMGASTDCPSWNIASEASSSSLRSPPSLPQSNAAESINATSHSLANIPLARQPVATACAPNPPSPAHSAPDSASPPRNKGVLCEYFLSTGSCPLSHSCPLRHLEKGAVRPVPDQVCAFFERDGAHCLRDNCPYFHGTRAKLRALRSGGATWYKPEEWMAVQVPPASGTPAPRDDSNASSLRSGGTVSHRSSLDGSATPVMGASSSTPLTPFSPMGTQPMPALGHIPSPIIPAYITLSGPGPSAAPMFAYASHPAMAFAPPLVPMPPPVMCHFVPVAAPMPPQPHSLMHVTGGPAGAPYLHGSATVTYVERSRRTPQ